MDRRVARHVPGLILLDREGPDVEGGLVRCLDGRGVRDIEPTAGGPERALQLDGADLFHLREIRGAIHGVPVDRRVLHHRPKEQYRRGIRLVPISDRVELTLYVHESPTCHVGTPTDEDCGVFVPDGAPWFARFAGPNATAATAMPTKAIVIATKPRGLIRIPFLLLRSRRRTREVYGRC